MQPCHAYCTANTYDFGGLKAFLEKKYKTVLIKNVLHISRSQGEAFVFFYGVVVLWGLGYDESKYLLSEVNNFACEILVEPQCDEFTYSEEQPATRIVTDHIGLSGKGDPIMEKLAISHGLAQSVKLRSFEMQARQAIDNTRNIPESIAKTGRTPLSRIQIAKMRGNLYLVQSNINLHFELLDTPDFFWAYPELEPIYQLAAGYLDVTRRTRLLNNKLQVIHELFTMLADEQNHKHSSFLEWIIIWLIAVDILIIILHDIFKLM